MGTPNDGSEDAFVHRSVLDGLEGLEEGDEVRYEVEYDNRKGKWKASSCMLKDGDNGGKTSGRSNGGYKQGGGYGGGYDSGKRGSYDGGKGSGKGKSNGKGSNYDRYSPY